MSAAPIKDTPVDRIDILRMQIDQINEVVDGIRLRRERTDLTIQKMRRVSKANATLTEIEPKLLKALERAQKLVDRMNELEVKALHELNKARAQFLSLGIIEGVMIDVIRPELGQTDQRVAEVDK